MLEHSRFVELFPRVYRVESTSMDRQAWIAAARLALPPDARLSHLSRFVPLGLEYGSFFPMRFLVARDLHLDLDGILLHRTARLPPNDGSCIDVEGALLMATPELDPISLVAVADWLLHRGHLDPARLRALLITDDWRPGVGLMRTFLSMVDGRSASLIESHLRCLLAAAGLPLPEVNADVHDERGRFLARGDLVYRALRLIVELKGRQHALDTKQFQTDIHRYGGLRAAAWDYVQVTSPMLSSPRTTVLTVHAAMVRRGYVGPAPTFGKAWDALHADPLVTLDRLRVS